MRHLVASMLVLATSQSAEAQALSVGATEFPRGEVAFPSSASCVSADGCGNGVLVLDAQFRPVSRPGALVGHDLGLVVIDLEDSEIRLRFDAPIVNAAGGELYLAQAEFLGTLADPPGQAAKTVEIRLEGSATWCSVPPAQFARDDTAGVPTVYYSDPEIKSDGYRLWFALVDLSSCGLGPGQTVATLDVRGVPGAKLDLALVGNTNAALAPVPALGSRGSFALGALLLAAVAASSRGVSARATR